MGRKWYHLLFVVVVGGVFAVLYYAPDVSTPRLPKDADHADVKNFEACPGCHGAGSERPMPSVGEKIHLLQSGTLRGEFRKCYMCHKKARG